MAQAFNIVDKDGHVEATTQKLLEDPITNLDPLIHKLGRDEINAKVGKDLCGPMNEISRQIPRSMPTQRLRRHSRT